MTTRVMTVLVTGIRGKEAQASAALDCWNKPGNDEK